MAPTYQYEEGLELDSYHRGKDFDRKESTASSTGGVTIKSDYTADYGGMEAHEYGGGRRNIGRRSDDSSEKVPFHCTIYHEDLRSRLRRDLKTRQISMIALGGALGSGLLINTGKYLAQSGPVSMLIGYALVGVLCYSVMAGLGEMAAWLPIASGFTGFANRFVDPALGFALGWNYWFTYIVVAPNNLIASTLVIKFWFDKSSYEGPGSNPAIYVAAILVVIIAINFFGVGIFGEFEFWLSSVKVLIMLGLIVFTFVLACGGGPQESAPGFRYWTNPGAFAPYIAKGGAGRFLGFWNVLGSASFSFNGAELVGVTVGEAQNPRRAVPRAVKLTFFRIVFFYIILIFLLGLNVPYNSPELVSANTFGTKNVSAKSSPFVVAASLAGVSTVPDIINVCLLVFTFSAANSDLYISTRALYSLAIEGNAPRVFAHTNDRGVPIYSLTLSSLLALIAFISVDVGAFETFQYFVSLVTIFGLLTWMAILTSHIYFVRARRAQVVPDTSLAYVSPFGINGSFAALIFCAVILFFNGFASFTPDPVTKERFQWRNFIVNYIGVFIFVSMAAGYKYFVGTEVWSAHEADLTSGKQKIDDDEAEFLAVEQARPVNEMEEMIRKWYRLTIGHFF